MKRAAHHSQLVVLVTVLAAGVTVAASRSSASNTVKPPNNNGITIAASPATLTFGRPGAIMGQVTGPANAGVTVTLRATAFPYTSPFKNAATAVTTTTGGYRFSVSPALNTKYQVVAKVSPPVTSSDVVVDVRVKVTLRSSDSTPSRGQRVLLSGFVLPAHDGKLAVVQRRTRTGWRTVARATLKPTNPSNGVQRSTYRSRIRIRASATYRVSVNPADGDHVTGISPRRKVRVH